MLSVSAPSDWSECNRLLGQFGTDELICAGYAAAEIALPIWRDAVNSQSEREPVEQAVTYLGAWLQGENDGLRARSLGDEIYRVVRASSVPTGTTERAAAFAAAHAVFALAFHLGLCRRGSRRKVFEAVRNSVSHASSAANWDGGFSALWGEQWLVRTLTCMEGRPARRAT